MIECVAVCCSVLQCVAVCCNCCDQVGDSYAHLMECVVVCCSVLQCVAVAAIMMETPFCLIVFWNISPFRFVVFWNVHPFHFGRFPDYLLKCILLYFGRNLHSTLECILATFWNATPLYFRIYLQ